MDDQNVKKLLKQAADHVPVTNAVHVKRIRQAVAQTVRPKPQKRRLALSVAAGGVLILALLLIPNRRPPEPLFPLAPAPLSPPHYVQHLPVPAVILPYPDLLCE